MENLCDKLIRTLCPCLIQKKQVRAYEVNDEHHKFIALAENPLDEERIRPPQNNGFELLHSQQASELEKPTSNSLTNYSHLETLDADNSHGKSKEKDSNIPPVVMEVVGAYSKDKNYRQVISENHPYYLLFRDKLANLHNIFQIDTSWSKVEPDSQYPLKIYCFPEGKTNTFKYFFELPTDHETYQNISNDFELQKKFDGNINDFKKLMQTPQQDAKLIYLSYKKILIIAPRDFQYVRLKFRYENEFWSICVSDMTREEIVGKVRGEIILTATRVLEVQDHIEVSVFSQIDMKMPIKPEMAKNRGFAQIRKYLDKVYNHIKIGNQKSII